jgi:hypothetical protein
MLTEEQVKGLEAWVTGNESGQQRFDVMASMQQLLTDYRLLRSSAVPSRSAHQEDYYQEDDAELAAMAYILAQPAPQSTQMMA